jgi:hypothetical protein
LTFCLLGQLLFKERMEYDCSDTTLGEATHSLYRVGDGRG